MSSVCLINKMFNSIQNHADYYDIRFWRVRNVGIHLWNCMVKIQWVKKWWQNEWPSVNEYLIKKVYEKLAWIDDLWFPYLLITFLKFQQVFFINCDRLLGYRKLPSYWVPKKLPDFYITKWLGNALRFLTWNNDEVYIFQNQTVAGDKNWVSCITLESKE